MLKRSMTALAFALAVFTMVSVEALAQNPLKNINLTGTITGGGTLAGTLNVTGFERRGTGLVAVGTITGTLTEAGGAVRQLTGQAVSMPLTIPNATCDILNLQLGATQLDLLGLQVSLSQVNLDITAQPGSGKLLGNLLCQISKLLDGPASLNALVARLNKLLETLG
jgi:hypothetical protein